ncbi:aminoglycoside phosphotransferase family protein [Actibacterium sp. XHP0104]|uniref:aminoglycoside phosphotransferase family protein n=1 Tax=Actibacterium sp. XHP0104 TaxID=2984335 RepID=UPI0021E8A56C|nr:phosphotransferase [Actibacterium sp. XHP0104]MCV2882122.1 phosphotransferase [Actibacterium sp. XHP0104]
MTQRDAQARDFIARAGWGDASVAPLAGDASNRRYDRLTRPDGTTAVLMDAPTNKGEDVRPFTRIARHLCDLGLSAPRILAEDTAQGFLLLEDLGDDLFARAVKRDPALEDPIYACATDLLAKLHDHPAPTDLPAYDPPLMASLSALVHDWYLPGADQPTSAQQKQAFQAEIETVLTDLAPETPVLIQRDYHAENLLWLPDRDGVARVGLLDFQDGMAGHPAYDLVSLLEDARRDVPLALQRAMLTRYIATTGQPDDRFRAAYAALGAQRNLRIIGVFARLCIRDGKAHYVDLMPRVWSYLMQDLDHPALAGLKQTVLATLPAPTPEIRERIKSKCKTILTR